MSTTLSETPAATCSYCGNENVDNLPFCAGCGTRLVSEPEPDPAAVKEAKPKSRILAVCLAVIFGPLGLFYVNARFGGYWLAMMAIFIPMRFVHGAALWVTFGSRLLSAVSGLQPGRGTRRGAEFAA